MFEASVAEALRRCGEAERELGHILALSRLDRYQASLGIEEAAEYVAAQARQLGLVDVRVDRFMADGKSRWWSFQRPASWSPVVARAVVSCNGAEVARLDHAHAPFTCATYSAATQPGGEVLSLRRYGAESVDGAVALVSADDYRRPELLDELESAHARGFVTAGPARCIPGEGEFVGRIELPSDTALFAFSVTSDVFARIDDAVQKGDATLSVEVAVDRSALMPVVSALLPGQHAGGEVMLTSHLCHPRPGANDNASGVAALLGVARVIGRNHARGIRFVFGPEYLGVVAALYEGCCETPIAVVNVDMAGEDQVRCGSPFILERNIDTQPSRLRPLAETVVREVFLATRDTPGTWAAHPFAGFSDHALFADRSFGVPAVQMCHAPDRFNHSAGDTPDKVSPRELSRSIVAASELASLCAERPGEVAATDAAASDWLMRETTSIRAAEASWRGGPHEAWARARAEYALKVARLHVRPDECVAAVVAPSADHPRRAWPGPFNARAMLAAASRSTRQRVTALVMADKINLAVLMNLAHRLDGSRSTVEAVRDVSFALGTPLDAGAVQPLLDALQESGWCVTSSTSQTEP